MSKLFYFKLLLLLIVIFSSCEKEEETALIADLSANEWTLVDRIENNVSILDSCMLDNTLLLTEDKEFEYLYGLQLCEQWEDGADKTGKWKLRNNNTELRLYYSQSIQNGRANLVEYWEIAYISSDSLILIDILERDNTPNIVQDIYIAK